MRKGSRLQRYVAIAAVAAAAGLGLAPRPGAAQKTFSGATEVVVVEVPVQVVKDGEPVRGLTANDFELYDGRKKVPITGFEVLDLASAPQGNAPAAPIPVSARRHFLILFDLSFSEPKSIVKARQAALDVIKSLHPTDLVAVATYSTMQGPQLVLGFTPDRQQIAAAVETLGLPKLFDRAADPLRLVLTDIQMARGQVAGTGATTRASELKETTEGAVIDTLASFAGASEHASRTIDQQTLRTMTAAFSNLAQLMGEVEGRKYVIYLSEGFDSSLVTGRNTNTAEGMRNQAGQITGDESRITAPAEGTDDQFGDTRSQNALSKMLDDFRRADCAIHTVNIGGVKAGAEQGFQRADGKESLLTMAKDTGGEFYENYNNLSVAMGQMLRRTAVTYVLSFQPDDLKPGDFHKLRVELKSGTRGARVVHRPGYYAPKPYQQESPLQKVLETAGDVLSEEHGTIATSVLAAPFAGANGLANVPVVLEVDGPTLLAGKQETQLPVEIYIYALDQNGSVQDFVTQTAGLDLTKAEPVLRQGGLKFFANLELPPGRYAIRTLVRNGSTGASSLRVTELEVPAQGAPALLPAIFQDAAPTRWVNLRQAKKEGRSDPPYLFLLKEQPYVPTSRPAVSPGQDLRVILQGYNLGTGDWKAEAKVLSADGKEVSGAPLQLVDKEAGAGPRPTRMVAAFRPPNLQPGDYVLRVTLTDGAGQTQTSTARFVVGAAAGARGSG
jgi:VWFA-related protein